MTKSARVLRYFALLTIAVASAGCGPRLNDAGGAPATDRVYARVLNSGVIHCAYATYPPGLVKDPNTQKVSGAFADVVESAAAGLGLKVEWTTEVGWGSMIEGLEADRYDMVCGPVWANSTRARLADFGAPIYYSAIGAYVRKGDHRFTNLALINDPKVKIATIDGEMSSIIAASDFPKASQVSLPQLSDNSQMLLNVQSGRADVTFVETIVADQYLAHNPGTIENLNLDHPIRVFPTTVMFRKGEPKLKSMMDVAIQEQINAGILDKVFKKYGLPKGSFLPPAQPYGSAQ